MLLVKNPIIFNKNFGKDGIVNEALKDGLITANGEFSSYLKTDGNILITYTKYISNINTDFRLMQYTSSGVFDDKFGVNGFADAGFNMGEIAYGDPYEIGLQKNDKIIVAGVIEPKKSGPSGMGIVRFSTKGILDTTFGNKGRFIYFDKANIFINHMLVLEDYKILVCGAYEEFFFQNSSWIIKLNSNGSLDTTFGSKGIVLLDHLDGQDEALVIKETKDKSILIAGLNKGPGYMTKLKQNGKIDSTFGKSGTIRPVFQTFIESISDIDILSDNKILVAGFGTFEFTGADLKVAKFDANGKIDDSFGTKGIFSVKGESLYAATSLTTLTDKKILVGTIQASDIIEAKAGIIKLTSQGKLDTSFNSKGILNDVFGAGLFAKTHDVYSKKGNNILVTGFLYENDIAKLGMAEFGVNQSTKISNEITEFLIEPKIHYSNNRLNPVLDFTLKQKSNISVSLFDVSGKKLEDAVSNENYISGHYAISLNFQNIYSSGVYFVRVSVNSKSKILKVLFPK